MPGEQFADPGDAAVEPVHLGVDLDPVAGRDHERLRDVRQVRDVVQQLAERVAADRGALEGRDRRALVAEADDQDAHSVHRLRFRRCRIRRLPEPLGVPPLRVEGENLQLNR